MHIGLPILLLFPFCVFAQSVPTRMGARAAAMGYTGFAFADESSLFQNVSGLTSLSYPSSFFGYEMVPSLNGANRTAAALNLPLAHGAFSAGAFRFGDDVYSEQMVGAGFAHSIGTTSLGLKANMIQYRADGFGTRTAFTVDVGGHTRITPEWTVGAGIFNVNQADIAAGAPLPVILVAAIAWHASGGPLLTLETEKRLQAPLRVRGGMEIEIHKKVFLRTGFSLQPVILTAGLGVRTYRLRLDFATTYQEVLSFCFQASAGFRLGTSAQP